MALTAAAAALAVQAALASATAAIATEESAASLSVSVRASIPRLYEVLRRMMARPAVSSQTRDERL